MESIVVVAPHPDDAEIGMGGTIAALVKSNCRVVIVDLSDGEPTPLGSPEIRKEETKTASEILGVKERILLGLTNREIFDSTANRKKLAAVFREYKPSIVFAPYWEDAHPDHIQACQLVEAARFYSKFVKTDMPFEAHYPRRLFHYFGTHIRPKFAPSFVFDVSDFIEVKLQAVSAYRSQFLDNQKNQHVLRALRSEGEHWGFQTQTRYGEPFICRENLRLASTESLLNA
jgi:N-acetylglucosamine malate deacetylase 1